MPPAATPDGQPSDGADPSFALALGGGGARGFAHVLMLEALEELGIVPRVIAGTSIGALIGAAYASGISGPDIRSYCEELFHKRTRIVRRLFSRWNALGELRSGGGSVFSGERILEALLPETLPRSFEALKIPLIAVTTDYYLQRQHLISTGPLVPAIAASCALPGVLRPIKLDGRVLVDGGFVNPVPFDLLKGRADIVAAIDISAGPQQSRGQMPSLIDSIIGSNQISMRSVMREKLKSSAPDIMIRPDIGHFRVLDFYKIDEIFAESISAKDHFKRACEAAIAARRRA
ncbi:MULTISPECIES: patatin-like phospholipase family protein [Rhodomicrobium]|uniref:patatin-like phospholipase family protein n=1 Tax=Rhodomicrobium TaxID=1068 RepID=UPI00148310F7|nr:MULTISPECIES: patatin-like phospholipase family protein [Rhodomicrobium]